MTKHNITKEYKINLKKHVQGKRKVIAKWAVGSVSSRGHTHELGYGIS